MQKCIICDVSSQEMPLIQFVFRDAVYHICSQHVPVLIHNSAQLADLLPGMKEVEDPDPV